MGKSPKNIITPDLAGQGRGGVGPSPLFSSNTGLLHACPVSWVLLTFLILVPRPSYVPLEVMPLHPF